MYTVNQYKIKERQRGAYRTLECMLNSLLVNSDMPSCPSSSRACPEGVSSSEDMCTSATGGAFLRVSGSI
jgi:hypothetical protein